MNEENIGWMSPDGDRNVGWTGPDGDQNIAWTAPGGNFKLRGAAIVRHRDRILLCTTDGLDGWYLPGGKVGFGETAAAAVVRELREETQLELPAGELLLVTEDMLNLDGTLHQEVCFYYAVAWPDGLSPALPQEKAAFQHSFRWVRLADLARVDFLPPQLPQHLMEDAAGIRHLVFDRRN